MKNRSQFDIDLEIIRMAASKLESMANMFCGFRYTDRHGDGPVMAEHAHALRGLAGRMERESRGTV